eukprot:Rhum_TRINITY_DN14899_c13_g1::Rhum_TRINITY_DN14899_c13_g1_i1::g.125580::m.125580
MMRAAMLLCMIGCASAGFFDRFKSHHEDEDHPVLKICDAESSVFKVAADGLSVTPYPPRAGAHFTVSLNGFVQEELTAIKMSISVHYGVIPIVTTDVQLCKEIHCPIPKGDFKLNKDVDFPSAAPSGHYTIAVKGVNQLGHEVLCSTIKVYVK